MNSAHTLLNHHFLYICWCVVSFPCGRQQLELLSYRRSLWNHSELLNISTDSWEAGLNFTESEDELMTVNATMENTVTNETELRGEDGGGGVTTRIVGGDLEKRGGSPWQVRRYFNKVTYMSTGI